MPSPEGGYRQYREPDKEHEQQPFYMAARFDAEESAKSAYFEAQEAIFNDAHADLSAYRLQLDGAHHVAMVGAPPPDDLQLLLQDILNMGEAAELPSEIVKALQERRTQMKQQGDWVEGHYRPGKQLDY